MVCFVANHYTARAFYGLGISIRGSGIQRVLSEARVSTYLAAADLDRALELYIWNAEISAAFMVPLHICEVSIRNSISDALASVYGDN